MTANLNKPFLDPENLNGIARTSFEIGLVDSPFMRSDASVQVVAPAVMFEGQGALIDFKATSQLTSHLSDCDWFRELPIEC